MSIPSDSHNPPPQLGPGHPGGAGTSQPTPPHPYATQGSAQQAGSQFASPTQGRPQVQQQHGYQNVPPQQRPQGPQGMPGQQMYATGYPQQGYGQPAPKKPKTGLWIGLGVVAVVLVGALVLVLSGILPGTRTAEGEPGGGSQLPADPKEAAKTIAKDYLTALSEGRADDAKAFLSSTSFSDASLLTAEVLKDSVSRAPMTDIKVDEPTGDAPYFSVSVSYALGGATATDEYRINTRNKQIQLHLPTLYLSRADKVDVTVNGVAVKATTPAVFPGSYQVASANKYLEFTGTTETVIKTSEDGGYMAMELKVSQAGIDLFREKVLPEAKACLASANLDPGCDMAMSGTLQDGTTVADGSLKRTQSSEESIVMESVVPEVGSSVPTIISSSKFGQFDVTGTCTRPSGETADCKIYGLGKGTRWAKASINVADAEPKVTWEGR